MKKWIKEFSCQKDLFSWLTSAWPEVSLLLSSLIVVILPMRMMAANRNSFAVQEGQYVASLRQSSMSLEVDSAVFQPLDMPSCFKDSNSFLYSYTFLLRKTPTSQRVKISSYDQLFIEAAERLAWDWTILAAIGKVESGFRPTVSGGLMGIMPATARRYGYNRTQIKNAKNAVNASVRCIQSLEKYFSKVPESYDKMLFIIASYVSGPGHISDAQKVAQHYGADPLKWDEVMPYILKMSEKRYYATKGLRYGRFNGKHTINYITKVLTYAQSYADEVWAAEG